MISSPQRRLLAYIMDTLLLMLLAIITAVMAGLPSIFQAASSNNLNSDQWFATYGLFVAIYALIIIALASLVQIYFWSKSTSMGKAVFKMKVVDKDTYQPIGFWKMLFRELIVKNVSGLFFGLGYLWILVDGQTHQSWHDKILNTIVIDTAK